MSDCLALIHPRKPINSFAKINLSGFFNNGQTAWSGWSLPFSTFSIPLYSLSAMQFCFQHRLVFCVRFLRFRVWRFAQIVRY